jgi:hypothetical protein
MIVIDRLLVGGLRFVLDKVAHAVDEQLNDDSALRQSLLEAQMRLEVGELSEKEYQEIERGLLERLRELREPIDLQGGKATVEATFEADEEH